MTDTLDIVILTPGSEDGPAWDPEPRPLWSAAPGPEVTVGQLARACEVFELQVESWYGRLRLVPIDRRAEMPPIEDLLDALFGTERAVEVTVRDSYYPGIVDSEVDGDETLRPPPGGMTVSGTLEAYFDDANEIPNDREIAPKIIVETKRGPK